MVTGPERAPLARYPGVGRGGGEGPPHRRRENVSVGRLGKLHRLPEWEHSQRGRQRRRRGQERVRRGGCPLSRRVWRAGCAGDRYARFTELVGTATILVAEAEQYRPGEFYLRELPAIRAVCRHAGPFALIVV